MYAGKLDENKNTRLLLEAFVASGINNCHLVIAGEGILEKELKMKFSMFSNIHFIPFQNQQNMPLLYGMADVFVLPSRTETWGLGINEAMACGKPVLVSSSCGAAIDLVKDGVNGYIFTSNNKTELVEKIKILAQDKKKLEDLGKASASFIKEFSYEKDCQMIEELMHETT